MVNAPTPLPPPARLGIIGGGQLGRMLGQAARRLGYGLWVLDPHPGCPAAAVADRQLVADYGDMAALAELAAGCSVVTFEFENVPAEGLAQLEAAGTARVHPSARVLETCRDRTAEKRFLSEAGITIAPYREVRSAEQLEAATVDLGGRCIVKSALFGYDGKGQRRIEAPGQARAAWNSLGVPVAVAEGIIDFRRELSVIAARSSRGELVVYPLAENVHERHILHTSLMPAAVTPEQAAAAEAIARRIAEGFELVGLVAVELFDTPDGLLVNELAPRPHNSGHVTIEAAVTCQFENHIRAVHGLPLGATTVAEPRVMLNLLGDLWGAGEPDWSELLGDPRLQLHLYGKLEARVGRKMGHATMPQASLERALAWSRAQAPAQRAMS